jgi:5'-nucleotidase/UDP-sugar diphosphatase
MRESRRTRLAFTLLWVVLVAVLSGARAEEYHHLIILHTNDIHGSLAPVDAWWMNPDFPPPIGNAAAAATIIERERAAAQREGWGFLMLDAGDFYQGTPMGDFSKGEAVIEFLNSVDCDAMCIGNHDFADGVENLAERAAQADFPFLGANIVEAARGAEPPYAKRHVVLERGGVRIGIFGIITQYMKGMARPEDIEGLDFLEEAPVAAECVEELRAEGVDIVLGLTHIGVRHDKRLTTQVRGIDVIIGGHSHTGLPEPYECACGHTIVCQTYGHLTTVGKLHLLIDPRTKKIAGYEGRLIELYAEEVPLHQETLAMVDRWVERAEQGLDVVIGYSEAELTRAGMEESPMGNLITDAMREQFGVDIAMHNSGGITGTLPKGVLTYRDAYQADAYANTVVTMVLTGRQVWDLLEVSVNRHHAIFQVSGVKMVYDLRLPIGERVLEVEVGGEPLDLSRDYTVATNSFLAAGGGEYEIFAEGKDWTDTGVYIRDTVADYIRSHSPVDAKVEGRIIDLSAPRP